MKMQKALVFLVGLLLIGGGAGLLLNLKVKQKLGNPGVKLLGPEKTGKMFIPLPESVSGWASSNMPPSEIELKMLPQDTTISKRLYRAEDGFQALVSVVLMGKDRTSIHKPEYCLTAQGWRIVEEAVDTVKVVGTRSYELPVRCFTMAGEFRDSADRGSTHGGVFVFWFVAEDKLTVSHWGRVSWITWQLMRRGVLPRWAYVTCFATCAPGQEAVTLDRVKGLLAVTVPEFQTTVPAEGVTGVEGRR